MFFKPNEKVREKRLNKTFLCWLKYQQILFKEKKNAALPVCHVIFEPFKTLPVLCTGAGMDQHFIIGLRHLLKKRKLHHTTGRNHNFLFVASIFLVATSIKIRKNP